MGHRRGQRGKRLCRRQHHVHDLGALALQPFDGLADDALSCIALALNPKAKILIAPAMNGKMWAHTATQANVRTLTARGVEFIGPEQGMLACGYEGVGRLWPVAEIATRAAAHGVRTLLVEADNLTLDAGRRLRAALATHAPDVHAEEGTDLLVPLRQVKDATEIESMRRAVLMADRAIEAIGASLRPGMTERQVAWKLEVHMREAGATGLSRSVPSRMR